MTYVGNPLNVEAMESSTADEKGKPQQTPMFKLMLSEEESKEVEECDAFLSLLCSFVYM